MSPTNSLARSRHLAGSLLVLMILLAIGHGLFPALPLWPAGLAAWMAGGLLVSRVSTGQKLQLAALIVCGAVALWVALFMGGTVQWLRLLDANALLLTMIASISFLRLVALAPAGDTSLPVGPAAYRRTLLGVALFGAFINMSAPILIADRLAQKSKLDRLTSQSITRVFSGCSSWSPFFGGMAVVLTYVPGTRLLPVMLICLPFAVVGFLLVNAEAQLRYRESLQSFRGYPITFASLWVPAVLAVAVAVGYVMIPHVPILLIIAIAAISVSSAVLIGRHGARRAFERLSQHVFDGLPMMVGELLLFVAAGVLAVGLSALVSTDTFQLPIAGFSATSASIVLAVIVLASACGLHPVITIAAITPLIAPVNPDPLLLAVTYLFGWSLGTCASPLSGTHIIFQGRYGIASFQGAMWNWPFAGVMYFVGVSLIWAVGRVG